jgi:hypothetical protein
MKIILLASILSIAFLCTDIHAQTRPQGQVIKNETVSISLDTSETFMYKGEKFAPIPWAPIIGLATDIGKQIAKGQARKYTATYSQSVVRQDFYKGSDFKYSGIKFTRHAKLGSQDSLKVMEIQLEIKRSEDESMFRFIPRFLSIDHAKAKIWTGYGRRDSAKLDLTVTVEINAAWQGSVGVGQTKVMGTQSFVFRNVKLGKEYDHTMLDKMELISRWIPNVPKSTKPKSGRGNFELTITVVEVDNISKRLNQVAKFLGENGGNIRTVAGIILN